MVPEQSFTNTLRDCRMRAGLRQSDVAHALGHTSFDRISHWENGLALPSLVNLFKLSIIYKTTPEDLYRDLYASLARDLGNAKDSNIGLNASLGSNPSGVPRDEIADRISQTSQNTL